jgi:hypothetical protein
MAIINVRMPNGEMQKMSHPDDWTEEQIKEAIYKNFPEHAPKESQSEIAPTPFNDRPAPKPERMGFRGIGADALEALGHSLRRMRNIPSSLEKSGKYIEENPGSSILHNLGQAAVGAAELGKGIINAPHDLNQYLAKKGILPESIGKAGQYIPHIPEDTGIEKALGLEADPEKGDEVFRALPDIAGLAAGGASVIGKGKKLFKAPDLHQAIRDTQAKVNAATDMSGKIFDTVEKEVGARGVSKIPIQKDILKTAETFLAKTPANKELIKRAKTGDYKALRELQADLRVKGEKALSSQLAAENTMGEEILSTRDQVNKSIQQHLEDTGHKDLAELLNKARKEYGDIKKTYFSTPALAKVFGKSQKVPKNPKTLLTEESTEMNKFMSAHPEVKAALSKALKRDKKIKLLKGAGKIAATAVGVEEAGRLLHR